MPAQDTLRWPDHWYHGDRVRCLVPNCHYTTYSTTNMSRQWNQLHEHCLDTPGSDHKVLERMLQQTYCAIDDCDLPAFTGGSRADVRLRTLFDHERCVHGSADMSNICSYVRLAREGRICTGKGRHPEPNCERLAFDRMMEKIHALPAETIDLIFEKSGFPNPHPKNRDTMIRILTYDPLAKAGERPPYWWPIRAEHFLWIARPSPFDLPDPHWEMIWTRLQADYANGRI